MTQITALSIVDRLLADRPSFHTDAAGAPISLQLAEPMLRFLEATVGEGWRTLETGAGYSTEVCAARGAEHTAVTPSPAEVAAIEAYCEDRAIFLDRIRFVLDPSERALPSLTASATGEPLDLAVIDGLHGFQAPFVDWTAIAPLLAVGGLLVVDDTHIWPCSLLREFLLAEPDWELVTEFFPRTTVFAKTGPGAGMKESFDQPYARARTRRLCLPNLARKTGHRLRRGEVGGLGRGVWWRVRHGRGLRLDPTGRAERLRRDE